MRSGSKDIHPYGIPESKPQKRKEFTKDAIEDMQQQAKSPDVHKMTMTPAEASLRQNFVRNSIDRAVRELLPKNKSNDAVDVAWKLMSDEELMGYPMMSKDELKTLGQELGERFLVNEGVIDELPESAVEALPEEIAVPKRERRVASDESDEKVA